MAVFSPPKGGKLMTPGTLVLGIVVIGVIILVVYLCSLDSYNTPYLAPFAPRVKNDLKDGIIQQNIVDCSTRPDSFPCKNKKKQGGEKK